MKLSIDTKQTQRILTEGIMYTLIVLSITAFLVLMYALLTV